MVNGVDPGELGSIRDRTLRTWLVKNKSTQSKRLMTELSASLGDKDLTVASHRKYVASLFYSKEDDRYKNMMEEYSKYVKGSRPTIHLEDGQAVVRGLHGKNINSQDDS